MKLLLILIVITAFVWLWQSGKATRLKRSGKAAPRIGLDEAEARAVLGVGADADAASIRAAHRRLIGSLHPDKGGSEELTRRVNAARDLLLKKAR